MPGSHGGRASTPPRSTYASWLNQVVRWFGLFSQRAKFRSITQLKQQIMAFTEKYNESVKPSEWVATTDSIFEKFKRLCKRITRTQY